MVTIYAVVFGTNILISTSYLEEAQEYALKKLKKGKKVLIVELNKHAKITNK